MRSTTAIVLVLLGMFTAGSRADGPAPIWPSTVTGYGLNEAGARKHAYKEAVRLVREYVQKLDPPLLDWQPSEEFVEKTLIDGPGAPAANVKIDGSHGWILMLKQPDLAQFTQLNHQAVVARRHAERQTASEERLLFAGWFFVGMLALLALGMVYARVAKKR